jgi:transcription elongation GreA/GreB family factor
MKSKIEVLKKLNELSQAETKVRQAMRGSYGAEYQQLEKQLQEIDIQREQLETELQQAESKCVARGLRL